MTQLKSKQQNRSSTESTGRRASDSDKKQTCDNCPQKETEEMRKKPNTLFSKLNMSCQDHLK